MSKVMKRGITTVIVAAAPAVIVAVTAWSSDTMTHPSGALIHKRMRAHTKNLITLRPRKKSLPKFEKAHYHDHPDGLRSGRLPRVLRAASLG